MANSDWGEDFSVNMDDISSGEETKEQPYEFSSQYNTESTSPSKYAPTAKEFQFVDVAHQPISATDNTQLSDQSELRQRGTTASFLDKRGFGWLMDVDDNEEDEFQKPLLEELDIDVKDIYHKLRAVLIPLPHLGFDSRAVRDNPDFWGPLVVVLLYSLVSLYGQFSVVSWIMTIWIFGSVLVFLLARVLGGEVNYSQCLGVIGYSLLPLALIALLLPLISNVYLSLLFKIVGVSWATYSAGSLLCVQELQHKRPLLLYPILLLYFYFLSLHTGV